MPFEKNQTIEPRAWSRFGDYLETFTSAGGQVSAELFRKNGEIVVYVSFAPGVTGQTVTDAYLEPLRARAAIHEPTRPSRIIYAAS